MISFRQYLTESIRQGLPHIATMSHDQFANLINGGQVHVHNVTEKTDGQSFVFGHDENGFFTQSTGSGSDRMRHPRHYGDRAKQRARDTGKPVDLTAANAFGHIHDTLQRNKKLTQYLEDQYKKTGKEVVVRGESFYRPWGKASSVPGEIKFVGTSYDPSHMGEVGKIVIHSKLPENQNHDLEHFKSNLSDANINFDDDTVQHRPGSVDVSDEHAAFRGLNHELINSRTTPKNKQAKMAELEKMRQIQQNVSNKVDEHVKSLGIQPKWGSGTEGVVVHPSSKNPNAPRFKVTSDVFRAYRASDEAKWKK